MAFWVVSFFFYFLGCDGKSAAPSCGDGVADPGETCGEPALPACPASCNDHNPGTSVSGSGSPQQCNVICIHDTIDTCQNGDGCCPTGCNHGSDSDCAATENCEDWIDNNRGSGRDYKVWWMSHLPHSEGTTDGKQNNWWEYIVDYDNAF